MTDKQRKFADKTRNKILKAAAKLFAKHGFSGTSMQAIADKAALNQALLYHHFTNKQKLWKATKAYIFTILLPADAELPSPTAGLTTFLTCIINQRFTLYSNATIARMMLWQQLEPNQENITGSHTPASPDQWLPIIVELQQQGDIRPDLEPQTILCWIASSVTGIVFANQTLFKNNPQKKQHYISMLIAEFNSLLKSKITS